MPEPSDKQVHLCSELLKQHFGCFYFLGYTDGGRLVEMGHSSSDAQRHALQRGIQLALRVADQSENQEVEYEVAEDDDDEAEEEEEEV